MSAERWTDDKILRIDSQEYSELLPALKHLFLVGDLKRVTSHPFVRDKRLEIILCAYESQDSGRYHWHPAVTEYELVIEGEVGYFEVSTGITHWFQAGDFCVIPPGACMKRLTRRPARAIVIKVPSQDDKVHCKSCPRECFWRTEPYGM